jgi:ribosomal protein S18 acetylase RimI-like enzyme
LKRENIVYILVQTISPLTIIVNFFVFDNSAVHNVKNLKSATYPILFTWNIHMTESSEPLNGIVLRPLTEADIPNLPQIRPTYITNTVYEIEHLDLGWRLVEVPRRFDKRNLYNFESEAQSEIRDRLARGNDALLILAEHTRANQIVGILDAERHHWNDTVLLWNLMLDLDYRGKGLGRMLWGRLVDYAKSAGVRAITLETQNTNVAACKFYAAMGCRLVGLHETYYMNAPAEEVALFYTFPLR